METFRCYYCKFRTSDLDGFLEHFTALHETETLKYRELTLDEESGKFRYLTKIHEGIIPCELKANGKRLAASGSSRLIIKVVKHENVTKKIKLNTPIKAPVTAEQEDPATEITDELEILSVHDEITFLLPKVIKNLEESGHIDSYIKYNELLASGRLPVDNICYLLFPDVVEWFSTDNTSQMRYKFPQTLKFWQIGNRLFHGKLLRFMSGLRNFGQTLEGSCEKGFFDPFCSKINFAIPSRKALLSTCPKPTFYPGINSDNSDNLSDFLTNKPLNLSVDGKKICRGKGQKMGDIDCWGFENKPTLTERKTKLAENKQLTNSILELIDNIEQRGLIEANDMPEPARLKIHESLKTIVQIMGDRNRQLRETETALGLSEEKLKKLGGSDWRKSKYFPAVASIRVKRNDIRMHLDDSMKLISQISQFGSYLARSSKVYRTATVNMTNQANYYRLSSQYESENSRYVRI